MCSWIKLVGNTQRLRDRQTMHLVGGFFPSELVYYLKPVGALSFYLADLHLHILPLGDITYSYKTLKGSFSIK